MKCKICNNDEQVFALDGIGVCRACYEIAKDCFILSCQNCNSYGNIIRTTENTARIASLMLLAEDNLNELSLNLMIIFIQVEKPSIIIMEKCPQCS